MLRTREHHILSQKEKDATREIVARLQAHVSRVPLCLFLFAFVFSFDHSIVRKRTILISRSRATSRKLGATLFLPSGSFPFLSLSSGRNFNSRGYSNAKRASVYFERESDTCPHRARRARESIRRKPQIVNILERARTKLAAGKCGAPKLRLCVRRARCTRRTYFIARALILARSVGFFFFSHTRPRSFLFCLVLSLLSFALCFCASYLRNPLEPSPIITYTTLFLSVSPYLPVLHFSLYSHLLFFTSCLLAHLSAH